MRDFFAITAPTATKAVFSNSIYLQLTADSNDRSSINSFSPINSHIPATMAETQPQVSAGNKISIVCLSDTHLKCPQVPDGDLLLHAGDFTSRGKFDEMQAQLDWLSALPHRHKVVVGGNHDRVLDPSYIAKHPKFDQGGKFEELDWHDITYLERTSVTLEFPDAGRSLRIYGCPLTPAYVAPKGGRGPYYSWAFLYDGKTICGPTRCQRTQTFFSFTGHQRATSTMTARGVHTFSEKCGASDHRSSCSATCTAPAVSRHYTTITGIPGPRIRSTCGPNRQEC
jgi:hypothetical protein